MVDEIGIDGILEVSALVVRQEDVDGLGAGIAAIVAEFRPRLCCDAVIDGMDDVFMRGEEVIRFDFLQCLGDGLLAEWTADLLEGVEFGCGLVLDEVDVRESAL